MNCCAAEEAVSKKIYREFISERYPEYLPYFELLWKNKDQPVRIKKTRGPEEIILSHVVVPFLAHFSSLLVAHYVYKKVKANSGKEPQKQQKTSKKKPSPSQPDLEAGALRGIPDETINTLLEEAREKFPGLSDEDYTALSNKSKIVLKDGL